VVVPERRLQDTPPCGICSINPHVCLHNEHRWIEAGERVPAVGLGDLWSKDVHPESAFPERRDPEGVPALVLAHNPDTRGLIRDYSWDVMLSGHTHGGQIVIPVVDYAPFVLVDDRRFLEGLLPWEGRLVHVTRGVGNILGIRLNCRPEVSILTLTPDRHARAQVSPYRRARVEAIAPTAISAS
jgi:predicted MPP superfamily phosphohydrolase